ncbi:helix-turn-helix domain-containing protein [Bacillus thuringiensis]|uniref:Transcriptional regulator n=1 Tax=Bacillus thuringiensis subsp. higo TaxID=132266 RepID=A0A9X6QIX0_BACUH|nr:helix-turn-helix transcriptional regulator [Bacillus thuringiensis]OUB39970.1 transcriptional regulator [Bacillus thuringiensis serovar higo]
MNTNIFGTNIKKLRAINGISRKELAAAINTTYRSVASWETGEKMPRLNKLKEIATYFNVTEAYLLNHAIRDQELFENIDGDPLERLTRLLYDKYMSVPDEYKPQVERELIRYAELLRIEATHKNEK